MFVGVRFGSAPDYQKCHDFQYWFPLSFDASRMTNISWVDSFELELGPPPPPPPAPPSPPAPWFLCSPTGSGACVEVPPNAPGAVAALAECQRSCVLCDLNGTWFDVHGNGIPVYLRQTPLTNISATIVLNAPGYWSNVSGVLKIGHAEVTGGFCGAGTCIGEVGPLEAGGPACGMLSWSQGTWCSPAIDPKCKGPAARRPAAAPAAPGGRAPDTAVPWPATYVMNRSTFVYTCNYTGLTDVSPGSIVSRFGLVAFDWSEAKYVWAQAAPMVCEETLVAQAAALKQTSPATRVMVYRNLVKALPWMSTVRAALEGADAEALFLAFATPTSPSHSPRCDASFAPPRCSGLFHDQVQTPQFQNGSKYDGVCERPCVCGGDDLPCGEYLWDHTNPNVRDIILSKYILGPTGMASGVVDGFFLDDGWSDVQRVGSNACDGSPIGGPSEVDSYCVTDMGLQQKDTTALTAAWQATTDAVTAAVNGVGGMIWSQFEQVNTPPNNASECAAFFAAACGPSGAFLGVPLQLLFTEAPGRVFDPLPAFAQDLATFLLIRGDHAWLGYSEADYAARAHAARPQPPNLNPQQPPTLAAWNGCSFGSHPAGGRNNQSWSFPPALDGDYGEPEGFCSETAPGSGVFQRRWTRATAEFDCAAWVGTVTMSDGTVVVPVPEADGDMK